MSELKGTEKFVAESLKSYFSKSFSTVDFEEGDDPPDIYLNIANKKIAVEITDVDQNVLKNRKTIDYGYSSHSHVVRGNAYFNLNNKKIYILI